MIKHLVNLENRINVSRGCGETRIIDLGLPNLDFDSYEFIQLIEKYNFNREILFQEIEESHARNMFCWLMCNRQTLDGCTDFSDDYVDIWLSVREYAGEFVNILTNNRSLPIEDYSYFRHQLTYTSIDTSFIVCGNKSTILIVVEDF